MIWIFIVLGVISLGSLRACSVFGCSARRFSFYYIGKQLSNSFLSKTFLRCSFSFSGRWIIDRLRLLCRNIIEMRMIELCELLTLSNIVSHLYWLVFVILFFVPLYSGPIRIRWHWALRLSISWLKMDCMDSWR